MFESQGQVAQGNELVMKLVVLISIVLTMLMAALFERQPPWKH